MGSKDYPYSHWRYKRPESSFETLTFATEKYHAMCRNFRNRFKWSPQSVDDLDLRRVFRIHDELEQDAQQSNDEDTDD